MPTVCGQREGEQRLGQENQKLHQQNERLIKAVERLEAVCARMEACTHAYARTRTRTHAWHAIEPRGVASHGIVTACVAASQALMKKDAKPEAGPCTYAHAHTHTTWQGLVKKDANLKQAVAFAQEMMDLAGRDPPDQVHET